MTFRLTTIDYTADGRRIVREKDVDKAQLQTFDTRAGLKRHSIGLSRSDQYAGGTSHRCVVEQAGIERSEFVCAQATGNSDMRQWQVGTHVYNVKIGSITHQRRPYIKGCRISDHRHYVEQALNIVARTAR